MGRHVIPGAAPAPRPREPYTTPCSRSCCWTPYGHRATGNCACHHRKEDATRRQQALDDLGKTNVGVAELEAFVKLALSGVRAAELDLLRTLWEGSKP